MTVVVGSSIGRLLTFRQASEMLSISLRQFRRLVDGGNIPCVKIGKRTPRIKLSDLEDYIHSVTETSCTMP